jgi:hypothetical protein
MKGVERMTTEEKNKARQRFMEMLEELQEDEIHIVPMQDEADEKEGEDNTV